MAIESKVEIGIKKEDFPILKKLNGGDVVVLFNSCQSGMVIVGNSEFNVGYFSDKWRYSHDESAWEDFYGNVLLTNK